MLNHWDNLDGSIERGYSGRSFFFANDTVMVNERTRDYARLLASVGINATVINNVNVNDAATWLITDRYFKQLKEMAEIFEEYGVKLFLCANYASSIDLGGLDTADPLDKAVQEWWQHKAKEVFDNIPNLGGFVIKADSEGRPGPFTYGRTQADGANMLARAVKPYGGIIIWRCFVYNCNQDWRDRKTDRARAQYDYFKELDGQFDENVILQIKNGPVDFQVREPVSPLFGGLKNTNQMLEVQIAQEYTGQQVHVCYLIPWFKEVLSFRTYIKDDADTVADIISGKTLGNKLGGITAVANTGCDYNWTGHDLAAANLYGFGRLSFDMELKADEIASEWAALTFGTDRKAIDNIVRILMMSWPAYEKYNAPLGIGWMCNPSNHYGPNVDGYEYDRWGTYHRADHFGIGVDRTDKGTGYTRQYNSPNYEMYNDPESCPDELVLFFHHLPYNHVLKSGKTVLQHIYDTHFEGVEDVEVMIRLWHELEGNIEPEAYKRVSERFELQLKNAKEWRDVINSYFYRKTAIPDEKGRMIY
jgi:alpha-glucuronidase